ncbi:MAG: outer membrane lipoprotein-sorting protein, partial [Bdellovibrionales bacterium]|nr:outer membrane lipoprotein-sorting protein [Bdellovibrionales bacterium]
KNVILKVLGKGKNQTVVIQSQAKPGSETSYSKILTYVSLPYHRIEKVEYFDGKKQLVKNMTFSKYKKVGKKYWRAGLVKVTNLAAKRSTTLELKNVNLKALNDNQFSTSALE